MVGWSLYATTGRPEIIHHFKDLPMTQSKATRTIIDTRRHIFGPKLCQKFVENISVPPVKKQR